MSIKKFVAGCIIIAGFVAVYPEPKEKHMDTTTLEGMKTEEVQAPERQSFDEYASNAIRHFVESGSDTPSPWYDTETLEDNAFFNGYAGDSPWEPAE